MSGSEVDATKVVAFRSAPQKVCYNKRDLIIYALGIGETDLKYIYEEHDDFAAIPTYPVVLVFKGDSEDVVPFPPPSMLELPDGFPIVNPAMILHGEQSIEILKPLNPEGATFTTRDRVISLYDKGKGALMEKETLLLDENNEPVVRLVSGSFFRGVTGFQGAGEKPKPRYLDYLCRPLLRPKIPQRSPDAKVQLKSSVHQAEMYRLSGDYNSIHIDPEMAQTVGFDKPIIHGLCTMGFATRAILQTYCENDSARLRKISVRFSKPAYPGETFETLMWDLGDKVIFRTRAVERDVIVLDACEAVIDRPNVEAASASESSAGTCASDAVFEAMSAAVNENGKELVRKVNAIIQYNISGAISRHWVVDLKNGSGRVFQGETTADLTINVSDDDFMSLATGALNPQQAFMKGKLKLKGNMNIAMKLQAVMDAARPKAKL